MSKNYVLFATGALMCSLLWSTEARGQMPFVRGDVNCDGVIDTLDVKAISDLIFAGVTIPCNDAADVNDDGTIDVLDITALNSYVTSGSPAPSPPFPLCGYDPTDDLLTCDSTCCGTDRDHFKSWSLQAQPFDLMVSVVDQFMADELLLSRIEYLSNPARKDNFGISRPDDHLTWYRAFGRDTLLSVEFYNQFGLDTVLIGAVTHLLLPTQKLPHNPPSPELDHYKAYQIVNPQPFPRPTLIEDQFNFIPENVDQLVPLYFLTPASKNGELIRDSIIHYVAYDIFPKTTLGTIRTTVDQFGQHDLPVLYSDLLMVPTYKLTVRPPVTTDTLKNHYKSWRINPPAPFSGLAVTEDQFKTDQLFLSGIEYLSNPAKKDTSDIRRPDDHLNWYRAVGQSPTLLRVEYENQFHKDTITIGSVTHLLVPCRKDPHPAPDSLLGHYTAYEILNPEIYRRAAAVGPVVIQDQFDVGAPELVDSLLPRYFLTPARKNNEPQYGSDTHYVAYEIFPKTISTQLRITEDQFGLHQLPIGNSELLLVPSHKIAWGPPPEDTVKNHYKGWRLDPQPFNMTAQVVDQFMSDVLKLDSIEYLANPAQKDNEPIVLPDDHLLWYSADGRDTCVQVVYNNQFGRDTFVVGTSSYLILPAQKLPHNPPSTTLDHYKAYQVFKPQEFTRVTTVLDQFDALAPHTLDRMIPLYLCLPASKNGETVSDTVTHYVAYEFFPKQNLTVGRTVIDQFGTHDIRTIRGELLMVPTRKLEVKPYCPLTLPGNVNCDAVVTSADIIALVNYVFKGGLPPCPCPAAGDIDCNGAITSADIIKLVNYIFKGGPAPCDPCTIIPALWTCPC